MVARKVEYNKKGRLLSTFCTPAGARTLDTLIKSQVLYQLSYGCKRFVDESTPAGARTLDTLIKSQVLYQLSYGCIAFRLAGAKVRILFEVTKLFGIFLSKKSITQSVDAPFH